MVDSPISVARRTARVGPERLYCRRGILVDRSLGSTMNVSPTWLEDDVRMEMQRSRRSVDMEGRRRSSTAEYWSNPNATRFTGSRRAQMITNQAVVHIFVGVRFVSFISADDCLTANIGDTVQIPCSLNTKEFLKAEDISVEWTTGDGRIIHSFVKGKDNLTNQVPQFKGRAQLFKPELSRGNLSLRLSNVSVDDEGEFECKYHKAGETSSSGVCYPCLLVAGRYSDPIVTISSSASNDSEVNFTCKSAGGYPEPKVYWSVNKMPFQDISRVNTRTSNDSKGRYNVTSILTLNVTGDVSVTCIIENERLRENRTSNEVQCEFTLYVVQKQTITSQQSHKTKPARCHHTCAICPFIIVSSLNSSWQPQTSGATNAIKVTLIWEAYMYTQKRRG
ncbi:V-set domain-containing T-cell activation inhibitor 1-like [Polypterus senegalus]|uniref:V-set domain-containing T-cell activation inhibitor 1-like n=1 Tax=Polypterus senegalus TaxID=55291 RepID=UPI00196654DE|nr:V-set domain-containing T-cell activation inhibitor 1-like [Polypterus senegalus]